jgi:hypothetical protein
MNRWSSTLAQAHHSYNFDWTYEVKLDGYRAIGVRTSRNTILYLAEPQELQQTIPADRGG